MGFFVSFQVKGMCVCVCLERSGFFGPAFVNTLLSFRRPMIIHTNALPDCCNWFCFEVRAYTEFNGWYYVLTLLSCVGWE